MQPLVIDHRLSGTFLSTGKKQGKRDMDPYSPDSVDPLCHMTGGVKSGLCGHVTNDTSTTKLPIHSIRLYSVS